MAIKKTGKSMKIITIALALCMLIPVFTVAYPYIKTIFSKEVILKVDGIKINKTDYEKGYQNIKTKVEELDKKIIAQGAKDYKPLPEEDLKAYALGQQLNLAISKVLINKLDIKVSNNEISAKLKEFEDKLGGNAQLVAALNAQGQKMEDLRNQIKDYLLEEKIVEAIKLKIKVTDDEIAKKYEQLKYSNYEGKAFAEVQNEIKDAILKERAEIYKSSMLEDIFLNAKYEVKDKELEPILAKLKENFFVQDEYEYKFYDILEGYMNAFYNNGKGYTDDFKSIVTNQVKQNLDTMLKIKKVALEAGLKLNEELRPKYQLDYLFSQYIDYLYGSYNPSDEELKQLYDSAPGAFDIQHTISGEIIGKSYPVTEEDNKELETRANEVMKTVTVSNFAEKAKALSKDSSASQGGNLGKADINNYVTEFKDAISKAKAGEIVGPIKTQYGYHIIYVISKDASNPNIADVSHILLTAKANEKSIEETKKQVLAIKDEIASSKLTWDAINSDKTGKYKEFDIRTNFSKIEENSSLPIIGYKKEINDKIFNAKVGDFVEVPLDEAFIVIQKTEDVPYKKLTLEEAKDQLKALLANNYVNTKISEVLSK